MKTILVVDDEFDILSAVKVVLEDEGYKVVTCANGQEALERIRENRPDLLITDTMMPQLTGEELLDQLHAKNKSGFIPSIVMSHAELPKKSRGLKWQGLLVKPFTLDELVLTVRKVLRA